MNVSQEGSMEDVHKHPSTSTPKYSILPNPSEAIFESIVPNRETEYPVKTFGQTQKRELSVLHLEKTRKIQRISLASLQFTIRCSTLY